MHALDAGHDESTAELDRVVASRGGFQNPPVQVVV